MSLSSSAAMKYQPLDSKPSPRNSTEAEEAAPLTGEASANSRLKDRVCLSPEYLRLYCVISTCLVITLLGIMVSTGIVNAQSSCQKASFNETTFGRDFRFMSVDHRYDSVWDDWASVGPGHEHDGEHDAPRLVGAISMFHQLHCLAAFRRAIQLGHEGVDPGTDYMDDGHWPHCFDYMRKTILCWADDTLETTPRISNRTHTLTLDGSLDMRQCRDSTKLIQTAQDWGKTLFP